MISQSWVGQAIPGPWQSWTPTLSGRFNDAKWTKTCTYVQIGKTVFFKFNVTASTTTPMDGGTAEAIFTLPVTSISYSVGTVLGFGYIEDLATAAFCAEIDWSSTTTARVRIFGTGSTYLTPGAITSSAPFTWTTGDFISVTGFYEVP